MSAFLKPMNPRSKSLASLLLLLTLGGTLLYGREGWVSIYDDPSDGAFGRSRERSVIRSVRLDRFVLYRSLDVKRELSEGEYEGFLTPLVFSQEKRERLAQGDIAGTSPVGEGRHRYRKDGIDIVFSLEKPGDDLLDEIDDYYADWPAWRDPVRNRYRENWVIRIHRAENVFEPWIDRITYNEALLAASLIADGEQWLWGVRDGADILTE